MMIEKLLKYRIEKRTARNLSISNCDLSDVELSGLNTDGVELNRVIFHRGDLRKTVWRKLSMSDVKMNAVDMWNAVFRLCQLHNLEAINCNFSQAKIENTEAHGGVFDSSNFNGASLFESDFSRTSLREVNLINTVLTGLSLRGADLRGADCSGVDFDEVDLRGADLRGANLNRASFEGADIRGAIFDQDSPAAKAQPQLAPHAQEIANAISPALANLIKSGGDALSLNPSKQDELMKQLEMLVPRGSDASTDHNRLRENSIYSILKRVGDTGLLPLMEALKSEDDAPAHSIAELIQDLTKDLNMEQEATTEDLLAKLIKSMQ